MVYHFSEIDKAAAYIIQNIQSNVILMDGEMGSGKTTLIKEIVRQLGSKDEVSSPTFALVNEYKASDKTIYHFDLYRLNDEIEALDFGIEEYLSDPNAYVFIEWFDIIENLLPENSQKIRIIVRNFDTRELQIQ
jgi:tRNA threonylcarbamoyladenosine biosynthesis protein TsaE